MYLITLSSIPPRFDKLGETLESLLAQRLPAEGIILNIPKSYRRFPDWDGVLPDVPSGIEIRRSSEDLGPATKILPVVEELKETSADILFCDDDRFYAPNWSQTFLRARAHHPDKALCLRGLRAGWVTRTSEERALQPRAKVRPEMWDFEWHLRRAARRLGAVFSGDYRPPERRRFWRSGYIDIFEGCSGVLVKPAFFSAETWDIPDLAWPVDDIWLSGMLAKAGIPIWLVANVLVPENTKAQSAAPLAAEQFDGLGRSEANKAVVLMMQKKYGIWSK